MKPWLIDGILREGTLNLLSGPPKSLKSWLALELAVAVATNTPALTLFRVNNPGDVMLWSNDKRTIVRKRVTGLRRRRATQAHDIQIPDDMRLVVVDVPQVSVMSLWDELIASEVTILLVRTLDKEDLTVEGFYDSILRTDSAGHLTVERREEPPIGPIQLALASSVEAAAEGSGWIYLTTVSEESM